MFTGTTFSVLIVPCNKNMLSYNLGNRKSFRCPNNIETNYNSSEQIGFIEEDTVNRNSMNTEEK